MKHCPSARQRGVFTIFSTLAAVTMLLFVGLVVDTGRMMVMHGELQSAADACVIAAAAELNNSADGKASARAALAGKQLVVNWARQNFQSDAIAEAEVEVQLGTAPNGSFSTAGTASARVAQCRITPSGLSTILMQLAGISDLTPQAVARAGLVPGGSVCALPLALRKQSYTIGQVLDLVTYLRVAEFGGGALKDDASYVDQVAKWGSCMVNTTPRTITIGPLPSLVATALDARYTNDPEVGSAPGTTPRRVLAVPLVNIADNKMDRQWACLELTGNGFFKFLGYANDGTLVPPTTTKPWCVASGQPLGIHKVSTITYSNGPFVPALLK